MTQQQYTEDELLARGWPPALAKAGIDFFDYALGLRNGTVLRFNEARYIDQEWVHLSAGCEPRYEGLEMLWPPLGEHRDMGPLCFQRGIDVRLMEIAWVADAPYGS